MVGLFSAEDFFFPVVESDWTFNNYMGKSTFLDNIFLQGFAFFLGLKESDFKLALYLKQNYSKFIKIV